MADCEDIYFDLGKAPIAIASATLRVRQLDEAITFYRDTIGLEVIEHNSDRAALGTEKPFLLLEASPKARALGPMAPGLFHLAFVLPNRAALGSWLSHAVEKGTPIKRASSHAVSEAIYIDDPEGNGIKIYVDKPKARWRDQSGQLLLDTQPLDMRSLPAPSWQGAPSGTRIGHVHIRTTEIPASEQFWTDLGLEISARYPGVTFFGSGGYHQIIATNVWISLGQPIQENTTGLSHVTLLSTQASQTQELIAPAGVNVTVMPKEA